jgi:hypothetical protein
MLSNQFNSKQVITSSGRAKMVVSYSSLRKVKLSPLKYSTLEKRLKEYAIMRSASTLESWLS